MGGRGGGLTNKAGTMGEKKGISKRLIVGKIEKSGRKIIYGKRE